MPTVDQMYERIERSRRRGLPRPTPPQPQPANLQGVAAALGQTVQRIAGTLQSVVTQARTAVRTAARKAGEFAAWTEQQQEKLFRGEITPATVVGTAASFILPTTTMQIIGGQKKADIRNPETAIGLGSDILTMIPVAGAVARAVRAGSTAARAAGLAARAARPAAEAPAVARLVPTPHSLPSTYI